MKRILLFSDGTGNSSAKAQKTNVWRLFQASDLTTRRQIAHYDDGVGTSSNKYLAAFGGAFGWGLKRNVIDLYKFLCLNYEPGDEIFAFGFSRGAYTIRLLVGFILNQGLVRPMGAEELDRYARAAYRTYRYERISPTNVIFKFMRTLRDIGLRAFDQLRDLPPYSPQKNCQDVRIHFLGLWDTVAAYEIPIKALKKAVSIALWPMEFFDLTLSPRVDRACHALSLDDQRQTFHPTPFNEGAEADMVAAGTVLAGRLKQVWFPGVHCNVGGGYPEDRLSYGALLWIMSEAADAGLQLIPDAVDKVVAERSPYARIYDSRAGFASFYRYAPRRIRIWRDANNQRIDPVIDSSVILRMADGTDRYAPVALPDRFWILDNAGGLKPMFGVPNVLPPQTYARTLSPVPLLGVSPVLPAALAELANACDRFRPTAVVLPDPDALRIVANSIWWRRVAYWIQFAFAVLLVAFPAGIALLPSAPGDVQDGAAVAVTADALSRVINAVKGVLPSISTRWTDAYGAHPDAFALLVIGLLLSFNLNRVLKARITDRARMAWHQYFRPVYLQWCKRSARAGCRVAGLMLAVALVLTAVSAWCDAGTASQGVRVPGTEHYAAPTTIELAVVCVALLILLWWRVYRLGVLRRVVAAPGAPLPTTFALSLANALRTNALLVRGYRCFTTKVLPALCIVVFVLAVAAVAHRAVFDAALASGALCNDEVANHAARFAATDFCWASGIQLEKDARYRITLSTTGDWFDRTERADVGGFPTDSIWHVLGWPLRRDWSEPWFKPIARIGASGNDEYVLDPVKPFTPHRYLNTLPCGGDHWTPISPELAQTGMRDDPTPDDRRVLASNITARKTGELFLYVNDAVYAPPMNVRQFYRNNYGSATVTVERLYPDGTVRRVEPRATAVPRPSTGGG